MTKYNLNDVSLKDVTDADIQFLYDLLQERDPRTNISHKKMPTFEEHTKFVMSKPYTKWYVIYRGNQKAGSIYLTNQSEIGIFLKKEAQGMGIGQRAFELLIKLNPKRRYLANVNPNNTRSINFFKRNDFKLIQYTYELRRSD